MHGAICVAIFNSVSYVSKALPTIRFKYAFTDFMRCLTIRRDVAIVKVGMFEK